MVQVGLGDLVNQDLLWREKDKMSRNSQRLFSASFSPQMIISAGHPGLHSHPRGQLGVTAQGPPRPPLLGVLLAHRRGKARQAGLQANSRITKYVALVSAEVQPLLCPFQLVTLGMFLLFRPLFALL